MHKLWDENDHFLTYTWFNTVQIDDWHLRQAFNISLFQHRFGSLNFLQMMTVLSANYELLELISMQLQWLTMKKRWEWLPLFVTLLSSNMLSSVQTTIGDKEKSMNCFHDFSFIHNMHKVGRRWKRAKKAFIWRVEQCFSHFSRGNNLSCSGMKQSTQQSVFNICAGSLSAFTIMCAYTNFCKICANDCKATGSIHTQAPRTAVPGMYVSDANPSICAHALVGTALIKFEQLTV